MRRRLTNAGRIAAPAATLSALILGAVIILASCATSTVRIEHRGDTCVQVRETINGGVFKNRAENVVACP